MIIDPEASSTVTEQERIKSIIEKRLVYAPPDVKASFPPVLRQDRILSAIISEPDYLVVAFLTTEEEKRYQECMVKQIGPLVGLITTGPEKAAFRVERAICTTVRSCTVTNTYGFSLGPDSTILLEDHHQIIETTANGTVSYTVPLAYIISYGQDINHSTVYRHLDGLVAYSTNMWKESAWLTTRPASMKSFVPLSQLHGASN